MTHPMRTAVIGLICLLMLCSPALATTLQITEGTIFFSSALQDVFIRFSGPGVTATGMQFNNRFFPHTVPVHIPLALVFTTGFLPTEVTVHGVETCRPTDSFVFGPNYSCG